MPVGDASQEDLIRKKDAWDRKVGTTHWPNAQVLGTNKAMRNGKPDSVQRERPLHEPVLSERAFRLTGYRTSRLEEPEIAIAMYLYISLSLFGF